MAKNNTNTKKSSKSKTPVEEIVPKVEDVIVEEEDDLNIEEVPVESASSSNVIDENANDETLVPLNVNNTVKKSLTVTKLPTQAVEDAEELLAVFNEFTKNDAVFWSSILTQLKAYESAYKVKTKELLARIKAQHKTIQKLTLAAAATSAKGASSTKKTKKSGGGSSVPSGFARPCKISANLAQFVGVDPDTELSRTDATKAIHNYIKLHNLQDPTNKRVILPDEVLASLMHVTDDVKQITYFNLQRLIKHNFITVEPTVATIAAE